MADDRLKNLVLSLADADKALNEQARLVVLAALEGSNDLAEVLGDEVTSPELVDSLTAAHEGVEPVGAFLRSITVQGFRGIGAEVTLPFRPGPGLTVVAGRNGSGKSTLAEGLELALTGTNSRWSDKAAVWSRNWRNLHAGEPARIRVGIAEEGSGATKIGVDWPAGEDVEDDDFKAWVQRDGKKREDTSALGWAGALEMYRPLLSYDELGGILEGRPSDFYDQLHKLLGLEQLTEAMARLDAELKLLKQPSGELRKTRDALRPKLESCEDFRAATALVQLKKRRPDFGVIRPLILKGTAATVSSAWARAERLTTPSPEEVTLTCDALRSAADNEQEEAERSDALAADRGRLLQISLDFHDHHGDQKCPVCGHGNLTADWAVAARAALERDQLAARALTAARAATSQARSAVLRVVHGVDGPPLADAELTNLPQAHAAYEAFTTLPVDGQRTLADHVLQKLPRLHEAYAVLRQEAVALIKARDDAWSPLALELAEWLRKAELADEVEPRLKVASEALKWLQDNAAELRSQRIEPLAEEARQIWSTLRQESNVELGAIRLVGQKTTRRVMLEADVDGSETEAFGVMSQGELQALALAIFIPRATSADSPFRFLVLDDPIQAMDPSKIDGFLEVLTKLADNRQVIVFTHDDRLPSAIRRSQAPARIVEGMRGTNSTVAVTESSRPATRMLEDAFAIAADGAVPDAIKRAAVPMLCREALESIAWDVYSARLLAQGHSHADFEEIWEKATSTKKRLGLAVNPDDESAAEKWLSGGSARRAALKAAAKGAHSGLTDYRESVKSTRLAVDDMAKLAL